MKTVKQKTRKGAIRRFKITGSGKILRRVQNQRHLRRNKSRKAIRNYRRLVEVKGKWAKKVKQMMGIS